MLQTFANRTDINNNQGQHNLQVKIQGLPMSWFTPVFVNCFKFICNLQTTIKGA
jgi:hypothetical protein